LSDSKEGQTVCITNLLSNSKEGQTVCITNLLDHRRPAEVHSFVIGLVISLMASIPLRLK
jgi:hypothetical protein